MSRAPDQRFDTRGFLAVFLGRGGLGLALALVVGAGLFVVSQGVPPLVVGGAAALAGLALLVVVTRGRIQKAAEDIAEAALDELL